MDRVKELGDASVPFPFDDSVDSDQGLAVVSVRAAMYCCS